MNEHNRTIYFESTTENFYSYCLHVHAILIKSSQWLASLHSVMAADTFEVRKMADETSYLNSALVWFYLFYAYNIHHDIYTVLER